MRRAIAGAFLLSGIVFGQTLQPTLQSTQAKPEAAKLEFEVADIRLNKTHAEPYARILPGGEISVRNLPMNEFLKFAYNLPQDGRILGGPAWFGTDGFDITGKATPGTPDATLQIMLQNFLAKEFKLVVHQEQRPMDVYAMLVGKGGSKLQKAAGSGKFDCRRRVGGGQDPAAKDMANGQAEVVCTNATMADLADRLPQVAPGYVDHPVVDLTGIQGTYDLKLTWVSRLVIDETGGLTMFDAVDKQLGLKLEARKMPMPVIVVDHVEKLADDN